MENTVRVERAKEYFEQVHDDGEKRGEKVDIVICIVSVNRVGDKDFQPRYLLQSAAAFHRETRSPGNFLAAELIICDVDAKEYAEAENLSSLLPLVVRRQQQPAPPGLTLMEKEKQDYLFCLQSATTMYNATHVLMVEDDVLPVPGLLNTLHQMFARRSLTNVGFIKLYHPERLLGYLNPEPHRWFEWVGLASLLTLIYHFTCRPTLPTTSIMFFHTILVMAMLELIGRQTFLWLLPHNSLVPAPNCCTPANIYPATTIHRVMDWLEGVTCMPGYAKDYALVDMISKTDLQALYLQPSLVQHVGVYSSLHRTVNINI